MQQSDYNFLSAGDGSDRVICAKRGIKIGYYREKLGGGFFAVLQKPFAGQKDFDSAEEAKAWLVENSKYV